MKKIIISTLGLLLVGCAHPISQSYVLERHTSDGGTLMESLDNTRELRVLQLKQYKHGDRKVDELFHLENGQAK